jgi:hypothetical protein
MSWIAFNFAFKFNLRRYTEGGTSDLGAFYYYDDFIKVGRCMLTLPNPR